MSGNQERLLSTFSRLRFDRTGRGGGPQVHWNVNFGLKWLWLKAVQTQHRRYTVVRLRFKFQRLLCCCLFFFSFLFLCILQGTKTFTVNVYLKCELSIPHTSWTCYLISGIVRVRYGSNVFACILLNHPYHYLQLTSLTAIFSLHICTSLSQPPVSLEFYFLDLCSSWECKKKKNK